MPPVDPRAAEIIATIVEFESSVAVAESALTVHDWPRIDAELGTQHRLTHALQNALDETRDARPPAFSAEVNRRIARISEQREGQMQRLIAFNHMVKQRLTVISRTREMRRVNVQSDPPSRILDTMQ